MTSSLDWSGTTNTLENSCKSVQCDCFSVWESYQQLAMRQLSNQDKTSGIFHIEPGYEARARRVAATYARIYLETFPFTANQKRTAETYSGRFYWMGLGAFASKTVAAVFDHMVTKLGYNADSLTRAITGNRYNLDGFGVGGVHTFAKGNLWLFMDISVWHFVWAKSPKDFQHCLEVRDTSKYKYIKKSLYHFPWSSCLTQIQNLKATKDIRSAFGDNLLAIEDIFKKTAQRKKKFNNAAARLLRHLLDIANQEQINILQTIVWNDPLAKQGADTQRKAGIPKAELLLSSEYDSTFKILHYMHGEPSYTTDTPLGQKVNNSDLPESPLSTPPIGTKVEVQDSRMKWINEAAKKYHRLMLSDKGRNYLEKELRTIASWGNSHWSNSQFDQTFLSIGKDSNDGKGG